MTIDEAYKWNVDASAIRTWMVNESCYFVDLKECHYNHTMRFESLPNWNASTILSDVTTEKKEVLHEVAFEFCAIKGHGYEIYKA